MNTESSKPSTSDNTHPAAGSPSWRPQAVARAGKGTSPQVEKALADVRNKVYPRSVSGVFARWRIIMVFVTQIIFYGMPWLQWEGRQAVLFDLGARKFYLFGMAIGRASCRERGWWCG